MKMKVVCGLLAAISILSLNAGWHDSARAQQPPVADLAAQGEWDSTKTYATDDIVTARGSSWRALKPSTGKVPGSTSPNSAKFWQLFARGFNPLGAYSSAATYQSDDLVTYQGSTWRAKRTVTNKAPVSGANWEQMAAVGAVGATGPQGPAGPNTGVAAGSTSAPSISFNGDSDTGIFSPGSGRIALVQNGEVVFQASDLTLDNTAVGRNALKSVTGAGTNNTALGAYAGQALTTGQNNIAVGRSALTTATTAESNVAIGNNSMLNSSTATENTVVGHFTMPFNSTGSSNVVVGYTALLQNTVGVANVAVGHSALHDNTAGERNVTLGHGALENNTTGNDNIAIGDQAGTSATTSGSNNIFIGHSGNGFTSNALVIGGPQTTTQIAGIHGATSASGIAVLVNSSGRLGTTTSSRRFKQDIETMPGATDMLSKLRPVTFRYRQAEDDGSKPLQYGLIAEEVEAVFPDLVAYDNEGRVHTVKYHLLPNFLLSGWQAQQKTIAAQAEKIDALEDRLRKLEALLPQTKAASLQ